MTLPVHELLEPDVHSSEAKLIILIQPMRRCPKVNPRWPCLTFSLEASGWRRPRLLKTSNDDRIGPGDETWDPRGPRRETVRSPKPKISRRALPVPPTVAPAHASLRSKHELGAHACG